MDLFYLAYHFARARWAFTHLRGEKLQAYQNARARRLVRFATQHAPFYARRFAGFNLDDWEYLPTTDKAAMMAHFGDFNTVRIGRDEALQTALRAEQSRDFAPTLGPVTVGLSSGTSGHRGLFLVSRQETAAWAGTILARVLPGIPKSGYRVALFLRSNSNLYERLGALRRVRFRWFDLMSETSTAVAGLNEYTPDLLVGPPSLLLMLANEKEANRLRIHPERLLSVAEVLEEQDKTRLEAVFGVPVGQIYQCTEGLLAVSCPYGGLHVQEDLIALQYERADKDNPLRATPLVTDLWRRTQPVIRYRLGDVLRLTSPKIPPCLCGSTFRRLDAIEGRADDVCYFPQVSSPELRAVFPDTIRRMVLLADAPIRDYRAEQDKPGHLRVFLEVDNAQFNKARCAVQESAADVMAQYQCRFSCVEVLPGVPPVVPGAKRRRVVCLHGERP